MAGNTSNCLKSSEASLFLSRSRSHCLFLWFAQLASETLKYLPKYFELVQYATTTGQCLLNIVFDIDKLFLHQSLWHNILRVNRDIRFHFYYLRFSMIGHRYRISIVYRPTLTISRNLSPQSFRYIHISRHFLIRSSWIGEYVRLSVV